MSLAGIWVVRSRSLRLRPCVWPTNFQLQQLLTTFLCFERSLSNQYQPNPADTAPPPIRAGLRATGQFRTVPSMSGTLRVGVVCIAYFRPPKPSIAAAEPHNYYWKRWRSCRGGSVGRDNRFEQETLRCYQSSMAQRGVRK